MQDPFDDGPGVDAWEVFTLAACQPLRGQAGCHVAPRIPAEAVIGALKNQLGPQADELLLAVVERPQGNAKVSACALTSQRLCWPKDPKGGSESGTSQPPQTIEYAQLPEAVQVQGGLAPRLDLGSSRSISLEGLPTSGAEVLAKVLTKLGHAARTGDLAGSTTPADLSRARAEVDAVAQQAAVLYKVAGEMRSFQADMQQATPRVLVSYVFFAICLAVYVVMVASGVSWARPDVQDLLAWGANDGIDVALNGQFWRLLTSMFLHGGLVHLAINMWCLYRAGPLIERLYGNFGFAALYLAAGLGGSLASAWNHPTIPSVGASGAIFGIIGGLGAFLFSHRHAIPGQVLQSVRGGVLSFVVINIMFGMLVPGIDNAAHLGGLATGFVAGLLLKRPWPSPGPMAGLSRQLGGAFAIAAALILLGNLAIGQVREALEATQEQIQAYIASINNVQKSALRLDQVKVDLNTILQQLKESPAVVDDPLIREKLENLQRSARSNQVSTTEIETEDPELRQMIETLAQAQGELVQAMEALLAFLKAPEDQELLEGPEGFVTLRQRSEDTIRQFIKQREAYFEKHELF